MKKFAIALALGLLAVAAHAQSDVAATEAAPAASETTVINPDTAAAETRDTGCVRETGTRIDKRDKNGCTGAPGESYSREDINRSGAIDTADAIRKLSPRATVRRGG
ncbi:MAG: hypothetical protein DCF27_08500 [Lysobacteraceae bacterium]|nr:MAG: hypothetical protein DCF27_08500 [Xanthomonadaceae bacterium]